MGAARHSGRPCVGQLLPRVPCPRAVRRLQEVRVWPRNAQDDARALQADEEHAHLAGQEQAWIFLSAGTEAFPAALGFTPFYCFVIGPLFTVVVPAFLLRRSPRHKAAFLVLAD